MILKQTQSLEEDLIQWVAATDIVADNWLPSFYGADFLALDRTLRAQKSDYLELGDLVRPVVMRVPDKRDFAWSAVPQAGRIEIRDGSLATTDAALLPREAILVSRWPRGVERRVSVGLWSEEIWGGKGSASPGILGLESLTAESVAWIGKELTEVYMPKTDSAHTSRFEYRRY